MQVRRLAFGQRGLAFQVSQGIRFCIEKMMNSALKMMIFVLKNDEFCIENDDFCIEK